jgi:hypothetical protein
LYTKVAKRIFSVTAAMEATEIRLSRKGTLSRNSRLPSLL